MSENDIKDKINKLSEAIVFAEPSDPKALADLLTLFEEINTWAEETSHSEIAIAANASADLIEKMIFKEVPNIEAAMKTVEQVVTAFQAIIFEGRTASEGEFPEALKSYEKAVTQKAEKPTAKPQIDVYHPSKLPENVDEAIYLDFLSRQDSILEEMEK